MSIITISRGTFSGSRQLATDLAKQIRYRCISRENLTEEAVRFGIPEDKLRAAVMKPPRARQPLGNLREVYLAFMRYKLCEYMLSDNIVYHGHTGHLLLPGIPNILRIRIMAGTEYRIRSAAQQLHLDRELTKEHIEEIDRERDNWVRFLYGINWSDPIHYDLIINLSEISAENVVQNLSRMAEWPEFTFTKSALKSIKDLRLSSYARVLIGMDKRTKDTDVRITADDGFINVTFTPQQVQYAPYVREILSNLNGCKEINTTIANANILWIQEKFEKDSETFHNIIDIAKKWDAAVELLKYDTSSETNQNNITVNNTEYDPHSTDVSEAFRKEGHSGGCVTVYGDVENLCSSIQHPEEYSLIIVDNLFLSKAHGAQKRMTNETRAALSDSFNVPVIEPSELSRKVRLSIWDRSFFIGKFIIAAALFLAVFLNQETVLAFMAGEEYRHLRIVVIIAIVIFVPTFAYLYATTIKTVLKFFKID